MALGLCFDPLTPKTGYARNSRNRSYLCGGNLRRTEELKKAYWYCSSDSFWVLFILVVPPISFGVLILVDPPTRIGIAHFGCSFDSFWYCSSWLLLQLVLVLLILVAPSTRFGCASDLFWHCSIIL